MASFTSTLTIMLWQSVRAPPDKRGGKGYNVYEATFSLYGSEMVANVAHKSLQAPYYPGTIARITADANLHDGALLLVAFRLIPAPVQPVIGVQPRLLHLLPRVNVTGVVASVEGPSALNSNSIEFTVTVYRKDLFPVQELLLACATNRDDDRLTLRKPLAVGMPVKFSGVICGWSRHNTLLIDVHTLEDNYAGPVSPVWAFERANPFEHAIFPDGYARFPAALFESTRQAPGYDVLSYNARPTRITRRYNRASDPRLRPSTSPEVGAASGDPMAVDTAREEAVEVVERDKNNQSVHLPGRWAQPRAAPSPDVASCPSPSRREANESDYDDDNVSSTAVLGESEASLAYFKFAKEELRRLTRSSDSGATSAGTSSSDQASAGSSTSQAHDVEAFMSVQDVRDAYDDESVAVRGTKRRRESASIVTPRKVILRLPDMDTGA